MLHTCRRFLNICKLLLCSDVGLGEMYTIFILMTHRWQYTLYNRYRLRVTMIKWFPILVLNLWLLLLFSLFVVLLFFSLLLFSIDSSRQGKNGTFVLSFTRYTQRQKMNEIWEHFFPAVFLNSIDMF